MIAFNQYTQPQRQSEWDVPLDPSLYAAGIKYQADQNKEFQKTFNENANVFMNIKAMSPQDEEVLNGLKQQFLNDVSKLNVSNLNTAQAKQQLSSYISQYANNKDLQGIAQRSSALQQELATKKDYESKGKQYISPLLKQAQKYIDSGVYTRDTTFNKSGFVAADDNDYNEIAKNTPEWEDFITKGGYDIHQKGKAEGALAKNAYVAFKSNPKFTNKINYDFEQSIEDLDIDQLRQQGLAGIQQLLPYLPEAEQQQALNDLNQAFEAEQSNPYLQGAWKEKLREDYFQNQALMYAKAKTYTNTVGKTANEYSKIAVQHQNAILLSERKEQLKQQQKKAIEDKVKNSVLQAAYKRAMDLGFDIFDSQGNLVSEEVLNSYGLGKPEKAKEEDDTQLLIGEKNYKKSDVISNIQSGNKELIKGALESYIEPLEDDDDIKIDGDVIYYEQKGGAGDPFGYDKKISKQELINKIEGNSSSTTVVYKIGNDLYTIPSNQEAEFLKDNPSATKQ